MARNRTTTAYLLYRFFQELAPIYPVYVIMFTQHGLDFRQVAWLIALWAMAVVILELPSGLLADLWSRRGILVAGMLSKALGFTIWLFWPGWPGFALGFFCWGFQEALCSGTTEALLFDALKSRGIEDAYETVSGRGGLWSRLATIAALLAGAWLYSLSRVLTLALSALAMVSSAISALFMEDTKPAASAGDTADSGKTGGLHLSVTITGLLPSIRTACRQSGLLSFIVFSAGTGVVYGVLDEYDFMYGTTIGIPVAWIGVWGGARFLVEGTGSALADRLSAAFGLARPRRLALWVAVAGLVLCLGSWWQRNWLLPGYFLFYGMMACAEVVAQARLQRSIASEGRATVSSFVSMLYTTLGILFGLLLGWLADRFGLPAMFVSGGLAVFGGAVLYWLGSTPRSHAH